MARVRVRSTNTSRLRVRHRSVEDSPQGTRVERHAEPEATAWRRLTLLGVEALLLLEQPSGTPVRVLLASSIERRRRAALR